MKTVLLASIVGLWAVSALAHSPLETSDPVDGAVLDAAPAEIHLGFDGDIRLTRVTMAHDGQDAVDLDLDALDGFASDVAIPVVPKGVGVYLITWRGLGSDGHVMNGSFSFTVQ